MVTRCGRAAGRDPRYGSGNDPSTEKSGASSAGVVTRSGTS